MTKEISGMFLIVMHTWFMEHKAWQRKLVFASSLREAKKEAALWERDVHGQFNRASTIVIPLQLVPQDYKE